MAMGQIINIHTDGNAEINLKIETKNKIPTWRLLSSKPGSSFI